MKEVFDDLNGHIYINKYSKNETIGNIRQSAAKP